MLAERGCRNEEEDGKTRKQLQRIMIEFPNMVAGSTTAPRRPLLYHVLGTRASALLVTEETLLQVWRSPTHPWEVLDGILVRSARGSRCIYGTLVVHLPTREKRRRVVRAYLRRGKGELVHATFGNELRGDLLSHRRMRSNQVRALLTAVAPNRLVAFDDATRGRRRP